jgi:uncharacterized protein with HEPN domain
MSSSDPRIYLLHIRDCCEELLQCFQLREQGGVPVSILFNAACRNLEIVGEASRKVGAEFRAAHPAVPWRKMNDLRNVLIHQYQGTDVDLVWAVVERDIPSLLATVRDLLEAEGAR